jgi:hypothetical protein
MKDRTTDRDGWTEAAPTRLRELHPGELGEDSAWAVDLLREAPAHRLKPGERQRVLLGLGRGRIVTRRPWAFRLAATVAVLVAATAIARAGLGSFPRWVSTLVHRSRPAPAVDARPVSAPARHRQVAIAAPEPAPEVVPVPAPPPPALPEPTPSAETRPRVNATRPAPRAVTAERRDRDAALVVQAMRALHRDGDPTLARALCTAYLGRHPDGPLAEEALALTIEAAVAQHDGDAPALAARYLQRYPNGPFRGLARQAIRPGGADRR